MIHTVQNRLKLPKGLRRSETYDWYQSQTARKPIPILSRRIVIASMAATPLAIVDPFSNSPERGLGTPRAEAISFSALILALISALELFQKSIQLYRDLRVDVELSNPDENQAQQGKVVSAVFDENEYTENVVDHGLALPAMEFERSSIESDGPSFKWDANVPAGGRYIQPLAIQAEKPGEKMFETMAGLNVKGDYFKVMTS
ncbi:hypothetical protein [Sedimentitalea nanhaiensis]|uniref:Uncharacterized protein n=1 Tax=Sedimentitalea nanhaiensis TaxID=999627 RepID=A0A1I7DCI9_9RHOB|nr:hypothetical protein [Sedimentitalea nanhaiensis]SFU09314.1 hypothetical protein SAMN05216236_1262 [Sedimentitalea nanhaiensis]